MKFGFLDESIKGNPITPTAAGLIGHSKTSSTPIKIKESQTYAFVGYKESIIEHLLKPENMRREYQFHKNTSKDEYGTEFKDCDLHLLITELTERPTTPGGAICEAVRSAAGGLAVGAVGGMVAAVGAVGNVLVTIYELASGANSIASSLGFDIRQRASQLAATKMYKSRITRQIHHTVNNKIRVALQGRVSPSKARCHKIIGVGSRGHHSRTRLRTRPRWHRPLTESALPLRASPRWG